MARRIIAGIAAAAVLGLSTLGAASASTAGGSNGGWPGFSIDRIVKIIKG